MPPSWSHKSAKSLSHRHNQCDVHSIHDGYNGYKCEILKNTVSDFENP